MRSKMFGTEKRFKNTIKTSTPGPIYDAKISHRSLVLPSQPAFSFGGKEKRFLNTGQSNSGLICKIIESPRNAKPVPIDYSKHSHLSLVVDTAPAYSFGKGNRFKNVEACGSLVMHKLELEPETHSCDYEDEDDDHGNCIQNISFYVNNSLNSRYTFCYQYRSH